MSAEQRGDLPAARAAYADYLQVGRTRSVKRQIRARLVSLKRQELEAAAKDALAQEASIAAQPGAPTTIAVPPLRFSGVDSTLLPLERGFADLLITDLSRSPKLTVLERDRIQTLVDEIARSQSSRADSATAVRSGRLLRAGRVVQGSLTQMPDRTLRVDVAVIDVPTTQALRSVQRGDVLEQLFAIEKQVAFDVFDALGVTLTPAQRDLVMQRPTRSVAAFAAFSEGLVAEDRGDLEGARTHFDRALREDPGFALAVDRQAAAVQSLGGEALTTAAIEGSIAGTPEGAAADAAEQGRVAGGETPLSATLGDAIGDVNPVPIADAAGGAGTPSARDPLASATGSDNPTGLPGRVVIIIRQPGASSAPR